MGAFSIFANTSKPAVGEMSTEDMKKELRRRKKEEARRSDEKTGKSKKKRRGSSKGDGDRKDQKDEKDEKDRKGRKGGGLLAGRAKVLLAVVVVALLLAGGYFLSRKFGAKKKDGGGTKRVRWSEDLETAHGPEELAEESRRIHDRLVAGIASVSSELFQLDREREKAAKDAQAMQKQVHGDLGGLHAGAENDMGGGQGGSVGGFADAFKVKAGAGEVEGRGSAREGLRRAQDYLAKSGELRKAKLGELNALQSAYQARFGEFYPQVTTNSDGPPPPPQTQPPQA